MDANAIHLDEWQIAGFWSCVQQGKEEECWLWTGYCEPKRGYGILSIGTPPNRIRYLTHRIAYYSHYGIDPGEYLVCHRCDNPPCVNPFHLFLGTKGDNHRDAIKKGRKVSPAKDRFLSEHPTAIFNTDEPYWEMWALVKEGYRKSYVARNYGVSHQMLNNVIHSIDERLSNIKRRYNLEP